MVSQGRNRPLCKIGRDSVTTPESLPSSPFTCSNTTPSVKRISFPSLIEPGYELSRVTEQREIFTRGARERGTHFSSLFLFERVSFSTHGAKEIKFLATRNWLSTYFVQLGCIYIRELRFRERASDRARSDTTAAV